MPEYRTDINVQSVGTFTDGITSIIHNRPIPLFLLSDELRDFAEHISIGQSVSSIQGLLQNDHGDNIKASWPSDMLTMLNFELQQKNRPGVYVDAQRNIGRVSVQTILDNTRNRLLTFLMELREQYPNLDISESAPDSNTSQTAQVLVNNYIYGDENTVASGREFTQAVTKTIEDLDSLLFRLQDLGVEQKSLEKLEQAVIADQQSGHRGIGDSVKAWLGNFTASVASSQVAANLPQIVAAISTFMNR